MTMSRRDVDHVFERLRSGVVPERGIDAFAVGVERQRAEIGRLLDMATHGEGVFKFLRGGYGCGKTFVARLATLDAQARGFATSFVVVSDNDLRFHRFDDVYAKILTELGTRTCPRGAFPDILDRWVGRVEDALIAGGADETSPDFDGRVRDRLEQDLVSRTGGDVPEDMARALRTIFDLKQQGETAEAAALASWLAGSGNVSAAVKRRAGIKGDIASSDAMAYLRGVLAVVRAAGYKGVVIVIDEVETILRMRQDVRGKSLNAIRQIIDAAGSYAGLFWVFTGTPDFFDTRRGVAGLQPLHDRIAFLGDGAGASLRQAQLQLTPFDKTRLHDVALRLRALYPASDPARLETEVTPEAIDRLIDEVAEGLRGDVGVVPRQFLRRLVDLLDRAEDGLDLPVPAGLADVTLTEEERRIVDGRGPFDPEPGDDSGYRLEDMEF
jgi:hypothetical protein